MATWKNYEARFRKLSKALLPAFQAAVEPFGGDVAVNTYGDDYYLISQIDGGSPDRQLDIMIRLSDAADIERGEPGKKGYLLLQALEPDGLIVGEFASERFTENAFVAYTDEAAWARRVNDMVTALGTLPETIETWQAKRPTPAGP